MQLVGCLNYSSGESVTKLSLSQHICVGLLVKNEIERPAQFKKCKSILVILLTYSTHDSESFIIVFNTFSSMKILLSSFICIQEYQLFLNDLVEVDI